MLLNFHWVCPGLGEIFTFVDALHQVVFVFDHVVESTLKESFIVVHLGLNHVM